MGAAGAAPLPPASCAGSADPGDLGPTRRPGRARGRGAPGAVASVGSLAGGGEAARTPRGAAQGRGPRAPAPLAPGGAGWGGAAGLWGGGPGSDLPAFGRLRVQCPFRGNGGDGQSLPFLRNATCRRKPACAGLLRVLGTWPVSRAWPEEDATQGHGWSWWSRHLTVVHPPAGADLVRVIRIKLCTFHFSACPAGGGGGPGPGRGMSAGGAALPQQ